MVGVDDKNREWFRTGILFYSLDAKVFEKGNIRHNHHNALWLYRLRSGCLVNSEYLLVSLPTSTNEYMNIPTVIVLSRYPIGRKHIHLVLSCNTRQRIISEVEPGMSAQPMPSA